MATTTLARSSRRKVLVTALAAVAFIALYEAGTTDSRYGALLMGGGDVEAPPTPGARLSYLATAYCKGLTTTAGVAVQSGIAAADPTLLPVGSVVEVAASDQRYSGIYTVLDTGPSVQGRRLDLYMWSCNEALAFGRQAVRLTVLRLGWNPHATSTSILERVLRRSGQATLPSRPLPQTTP